MKKFYCLLGILTILYWACSSAKENPDQRSTNDIQHNNSHLVRVFPGLGGTDVVNPGNLSRPLLYTYLNNSDFPILYAPTGCSVSNTNYQILNINTTNRASLKWLENRTVLVSYSNTSINNLITKPGNDPANPKYYEPMLGDGKAGCTYYICVNKQLDSFHFNNRQYIHLPMAYHNKINHETNSVDTLENFEFSLTTVDYDSLNSLAKTYSILRGGIDDMTHDTLNVYKERDTLPVLRISRVKN